MRLIWNRLFAVCLVGGALLTLPHLSYAFPPGTLAEALPRSTDIVRQRVPLLIIDAEGARLDWGDRAGQQKMDALYGTDTAKPPLSEILGGYDRQIVSCSSVQVVAPLTRVVLNSNPGPLDDWLHFGRDQATKMLLVSLTEGQWTTITGPQGLGINDLASKEQKAWFRSILPAPFVLRSVTLHEEKGYPVPDKGEAKTIAPEQVRIHLVRKMSWAYKTGQSGRTSFSDPAYGGHKAGDTYWEQEAFENQVIYPESLRDVVRLQEPNKLKKSDIGFNTPPLYGAQITLTGVETVGDLVQRVAEKTGLELYADRRISGLKVRILGPQDAVLDTADVMKALCYAVTGAIRKVDDEKGNAVYILTRDREGLAATRMQLAEWAGDLDVLHSEAEESFQSMMRTKNLAAKIGFGQNALGVSPEIMARMEAEYASPVSRGQWQGRVAIQELSPELQVRVANEVGYLKRNIQGNNNGQTTDTQNIYATFTMQTELLVPGYGAFAGSPLGDLQAILPHQPENRVGTTTTAPERIVLPPAMKTFAALKIFPHSDADTDKAVAWAKKQGFTALFVVTSLWDKGELTRLTHAIQAGKANGIDIYPAASVWKAPPFDKTMAGVPPNNLPRTPNLFGETLREYASRRKDAPAVHHPHYYGDYNGELEPYRDGDWLDGDSEAARTAIAGQLRSVAATPGIRGIVLMDGAPPGFDLGDNMSQSKFAGYFGGYNKPLRTDLIRLANIDPIDLPPTEELAPYFRLSIEKLVPFFTVDSGILSPDLYELFRQFPSYRRNSMTGQWSKKEPYTDLPDNDAIGWDTIRRQKNRDWVSEIRSEAKVPGSVPLFWENTKQENWRTTSWTALWDTADPLPPTKNGKDTLLTVELMPKDEQEQARLKLSWLRGSSKATKEIPYTGVVIDISEMDSDKAFDLLRVLAPSQ